jgi:hypothetical protein
MNRISAISLLTIASLASCSRAIAQQPAMKANIPFNFTIGNTWMPAGEYTITSPVREVIQLRSADHSRIASLVSTQSNEESKSGSELVFERYGNQYFLHRVLCPTVSELNLDVPEGKVEKIVRKRTLEASNPDKGQETLVAAR